ncbi:hypothetical protein J4Q44_G00084470 [Coregonus suidteri]|uniref:Uncharacterized protein n=1 Tax=Coregonus suidteri TaxID=861788 RepID=A0AAN8R202_9TELE
MLSYGPDNICKQLNHSSTHKLDQICQSLNLIHVFLCASVISYTALPLCLRKWFPAIRRLKRHPLLSSPSSPIIIELILEEAVSRFPLFSPPSLSVSHALPLFLRMLTLALTVQREVCVWEGGSAFIASVLSDSH